MVKMASSWQENGNAPESNGYPVPSGGSARRLRMPTVHEALPYTPLSSIVPFSPGESVFTLPTAAHMSVGFLPPYLSHL